ncbi:MAG: hypothetical protein IKX76_01645 [Eubacterium sp.]|nr:hypothetical protein [Eubacterium sp.]
MMSKIEIPSDNPLSFKEETNYKNRILVFHDRLKRHLTSEYAFLTERKDALENEVMEMRFELEQRDKKLFKSNEQKDTRQYFSPLSLVETDDNHKDERVKQLTADVSRLENEIDQYVSKMREIQEFLIDMERIQEEMESNYEK